MIARGLQARLLWIILLISVSREYRNWNLEIENKIIRRTLISSNCWIEFSAPCQLSEVDTLCLVSVIGGYIVDERRTYKFFEGVTLVALLLE